MNITPAAQSFLTQCRREQTTVYATDIPDWELVRELEREGLVTLEWWGPRSTMIRPVAP